MGFDKIEREIEISSVGGSTAVGFKIQSGEVIQLAIPPTVYPPRRDTRLMLDGLAGLTCSPGHLVEVGCGSGAISIAMALVGWKVSAFDINPIAVATTRGNAIEAGVAESIRVEEGGVGEDGWKIPSDADVIIWNLPYLDPPTEEGERLGPMEEAALGDEEELGWSSILLNSLNEGESQHKTFILLFRTDPYSLSSPNDWVLNGWSSRRLAIERVGDETLEVVAFWIPGNNGDAHYLEESVSTMDDARELPNEGWQRIRAGIQRSGRGRRGSQWQSQAGDLTATWSLDQSVLNDLSPGLLQVAVGACVADVLSMDLKWPNDLLINGRKAGGVLIESSSLDGRVRIGIGLNQNPSHIEGREVAGWTESIGDIDDASAFQIVDAAIASILDDSVPIATPESSQLQRASWAAMSRALSRGAKATCTDMPVRIAGLKKSGTLIAIDGSRLLEIDDLGELVISF
jgi:BirA family biotin operon repressor/biotin-[acetyl-CoA-carboxylase] ligase